MPILPFNLEEVAETIPNDIWHGRALRCLAMQLGAGDDFHYVLLGAARLIDGMSASQAEHFERTGERL